MYQSLEQAKTNEVRTIYSELTTMATNIVAQQKVLGKDQENLRKRQNAMRSEIVSSLDSLRTSMGSRLDDLDHSFNKKIQEIEEINEKQDEEISCLAKAEGTIAARQDAMAENIANLSGRANSLLSGVDVCRPLKSI